MSIKELVRKYKTDELFRNKVELYGGAASNLVFAVVQLYGGIRYQSTWFGAFAVYYAVLTVVSFYLAKSQGRKGTEAWAVFRVAGFVMTVLNLALVVMISMMIANPSLAIHRYGMAIAVITGLWTLGAAGMAVANLVRANKKNEPLELASRLVQMVAAVVSVLILQTSIIASASTMQIENTLGHIEEIETVVGLPAEIQEFLEDAFWDLAMSNDITGVLVGMFASGVTLYMIVRGTIERKRSYKTKVASRSKTPD